jgi:hypothetical protein
LQVRAKPKLRACRALEHTWITAAQQRYLARLQHRERQQLQHRDPACHRFGNTLHQRSFLGTGENPLPPAFGNGIDPAAYMAEQLRSVLDLIDDGGQLQLIQESTRIAANPGDYVGILEQHIGRPWKDMPQQRRLPALAWTRQ